MWQTAGMQLEKVLCVEPKAVGSGSCPAPLWRQLCPHTHRASGQSSCTAPRPDGASGPALGPRPPLRNPFFVFLPKDASHRP